MSYPLDTEDPVHYVHGEIWRKDMTVLVKELMENKKRLKNNQLEQGREVLSSLNSVHSHEQRSFIRPSLVCQSWEIVGADDRKLNASPET